MLAFLDVSWPAPLLFQSFSTETCQMLMCPPKSFQDFPIVTNSVSVPSFPLEAMSYVKQNYYLFQTSPDVQIHFY